MLDSESEIRYFTAGEDDDFVSGWYRVEDGKRSGSPIDLPVPHSIPPLPPLAFSPAESAPVPPATPVTPSTPSFSGEFAGGVYADPTKFLSPYDAAEDEVIEIKKEVSILNPDDSSGEDTVITIKGGRVNRVIDESVVTLGPFTPPTYIDDPTGAVIKSGRYGSLLFIPDDPGGSSSGEWVYKLFRRNGSVLALDEDEVVTDVFTLVYGDIEQTITVTVTGANDPFMPSQLYGFLFSTVEGVAVGTVLGKVTGRDPEGDTPIFSIVSGNVGNKFSINSASGVITIIGELDYETAPFKTVNYENGDQHKIPRYDLTIAVNDGISPPALIKVNVPIHDIDDTPPVIASSSTSTSIPGDAPGYVSDLEFTFTDTDTIFAGITDIAWRISGEQADKFVIYRDPLAYGDGYRLKLKYLRTGEYAKLNHNGDRELHLQIRGVDLEGNISDPISVIVHVTAPNINVPSLTTVGTGSITEHLSGQETGVTFTITDLDADDVNQFQFIVNDSRFEVVDIGGVWTLKAKNGVSFNSNIVSSIKIQVSVSDGVNTSAKEKLEIAIIPVDDGDAKFFISNEKGIRNAPEVGTILTVVQGKEDPDGHIPGTIIFEWFHVGSPDVVIGRGNFYTVTEDDIGFQIHFRAIYKDGGGMVETVTANAGSVTGVVTAADETGNNADSGKARVFIGNANGIRENPQTGTLLSAFRGKDDPDGHMDDPTSVQWFHLNTPEVIIGTEYTYTVTDDDIGHRIMFRAFYIDGDGRIETVLTNLPAISGVVNPRSGVKNKILASGTAVSITEGEEGFTTDITIRVQDFYRDYLTFKDENFIITMKGLITDLSKSKAAELFEVVTVDGKWKLKLKDGVSLDYEEGTSFSISIGIKNVPNSRGNIQPANPITIDVTVVDVNELAEIQISGPDLSIIDIGDELTVKVIKEDDDGLHATPNIAYKWFHASDPDTAIGTGTSYYIKATDHGKQIGVERTYTDINGNQDKVVEMMDANIILADANKARFIISNKHGIADAPKVGTVLTALRILDDPDGHRPGSTIFEWYHVGTPDEVIGRGNSYTVVEGDIGFQIRFRAIYTDGNGQVETINANTGSITGIVAAADETGNNGDEGDAKFFISNENQIREAPTIGTVLTALSGKADPDGNGNGPIEIQWFHINAPEVVIGTKNTYTVTADDVGHRLMFRAFYIDGDGKIESVLANTPSISGVVTAPTGTTNTLLASSTTASITENEDGFVTSLTLRVQDSANNFLTLEKDKFIITMNNRISDLGKSNAAEMFEVINDNGVWKLKLKDGLSFNFEKDTSFSISITVNDIENSAGVVVPSNTITITITIANANEFADIQIVAPDPSEIDIGDKLTVTVIEEDEDGLHATPSITFKWFYASDPDTVIGTGDSYIVKATDRGEKIGVERTYTDIYGNQDKVVDILDIGVLRVEVTAPPPPPTTSPTPSAAPPVDTTVTVEPETASKVKAGDGSDTITDGNRNDIIIGGKGDDVIDLGHDEEGKDQDQVVYGIGDQSAKDGGDTITNFNRGRDSFIFSLEANSDTNAIDGLDDFLDYVIGGTPNDLSDDQLLVGLNFNFNSLGSVELTGISFHFHDSVSFGGGRVAIPIVTVHFSETLDQQAIINALGGDLSTALSSFNSDGILTNIDYLDDLMGGVGSIGYQIDTL